MTLIMRLVRSEMLEVLRADYIRFARARGLKERVINFRHALKNTLVPVITVTGLQLGAIIAFAIITETVFQWPGVGLLFINAIQFVDIPVMAAYLMLISVMFVAINLIVDLLYFSIDPRLRVDRSDGGGLTHGSFVPRLELGFLLVVPPFPGGDAFAGGCSLPRFCRCACALGRAIQSVRSGIAQPYERVFQANGTQRLHRRRVLARHGRPGPRCVLHDPLRHAHLAVRRLHCRALRHDPWCHAGP